MNTCIQSAVHCIREYVSIVYMNTVGVKIVYTYKIPPTELLIPKLPLLPPHTQTVEGEQTAFVQSRQRTRATCDSCTVNDPADS